MNILEDFIRGLKAIKIALTLRVLSKRGLARLAAEADLEFARLDAKAAAAKCKEVANVNRTD